MCMHDHMTENDMPFFLPSLCFNPLVPGIFVLAERSLSADFLRVMWHARNYCFGRAKLSFGLLIKMNSTRKATPKGRVSNKGHVLLSVVMHQALRAML
ncbi:hypothetical protein BJX96DRAFT_147392 [Aspergillus floccosus]